MLNKKVKGEGLKTLFIYVRVGKGKKGKIKKWMNSNKKSQDEWDEEKTVVRDELCNLHS